MGWRVRGPVADGAAAGVWVGVEEVSCVFFYLTIISRFRVIGSMESSDSTGGGAGG